MDRYDLAQLLALFLILIVASPLLGRAIYRVINGSCSKLLKIFYPFEWGVKKILGANYYSEMSAKEYAVALILFNLVGFIFLFLIQLFQNYLPLNPENLPAVSWDLSFNTAISFITNTNWQSYSGEVTLSYFTQMLGLTVQNFLSAATGAAVLFALARGLAKNSNKTLGNFWADISRFSIYILLPLSIIFSLVLVFEGVIQNLASYNHVVTIEGASQAIPGGPVASQVAIKQLGTNGGGFFSANSAHPFENPTPFTNFLELLAILLLPSSLIYTFGKMINNKKHAYVIFGVMVVLLLAVLGLASYYEIVPSLLSNSPLPMEGKETRFGVFGSVVWAIFSTAASNGSVNSMISSLSPIAGGVAMFNILLGEIIFGGVGAGLYGMVLFILLTVFLSGLMVGRTPEYLGKKLSQFDMKMVMIAIILPGAIILIGSAISLVNSYGLKSMSTHGPHGFSEIIYAFTSAAGNNGSAFAGIQSNSIYYNLFLGIVMLLGRFGVILPVLAIAGSFVSKTYNTPSAGTFKTESFLFVFLLIFVILVIGGLTFFPILSLGPILEHLLNYIPKG